MRCDWVNFLKILPPWVREQADQQGRDALLELRMRLGSPPEMVMLNGSLWMQRITKEEDLTFTVNTASQYSPWSVSTIRNGYVTAYGGHRVGICGIASVTEHGSIGIRNPTSVCIRVARDIPGIAAGLTSCCGSVLIIGKPGSGKTTLLRDLIRQKSNAGDTICVVDEKAEIFPMHDAQFCFPIGARTDVMTGCSKAEGIDALIRNMGPGAIAVDEITTADDCNALHHCAWCGVALYATAHAANLKDLSTRAVYKPLIRDRLFDTVVVLHPDKTWHTERLNQ